MKYEIIHAILSLRPGAEVSIVDNSLSGITWHDTKQSQPSDSEINAEIVRLDAAEPMRLLRLERDKRLTETDWMTNSDAPTMSTAWKIIGRLYEIYQRVQTQNLIQMTI